MKASIGECMSGCLMISGRSNNNFVARETPFYSLGLFLDSGGALWAEHTF